MGRIYRILYVCILLIGLTCQGCLTAVLDPDSRENFAQDTSDPPGWYTNYPQSEEYIYAVGWSGPTYKPSKARDQAMGRAIKMLAASVKTYVKSEAILWEDMNKVHASDSLIDISIQGIVSGFEIISERRIMEDGKNKSRPGTVYMLIRIPKSKISSQ